MTEEEAVLEMRKFYAAGDPEIDHSRADTILADFLEEHGFQALAIAYREARKNFWYS